MTKSKIFRLVLFLFFFTAEVRVSAKTIFEPEGCLAQKNLNCAMQASKKYRLDFGNAEIQLAPFTTLIRNKEKLAEDIKLLKGGVWVKSKGQDIVIKTLYGVFRGSGEFYLKKKEGRNKKANRFYISVIKGEVLFSPIGAEESVRVIVGQMNWLGAVGEDGVALSGFPQAINVKEMLMTWRSFYKGSKEDFEREARVFFDHVKAENERTVRLYKNYAKRRIAAAEEKERKRLDRAQKVRQAELEVRELFRKRNYY